MRHERVVFVSIVDGCVTGNGPGGEAGDGGNGLYVAKRKDYRSTLRAVLSLLEYKNSFLLRNTMKRRFGN